VGYPVGGAMRSTAKRTQRWLGIVALVAVSSLATPAAQARGPVSGTDTVALSALPPEAQQVQRLIYSGGPFRYDKDGSVFFNREQLLPRQPRGFYREYTVPTPRSRNRGARRIVCGGKQPTKPEACYFTGDHYASFQRIVQ
jgi:ribonuclease T1